MKGRQSHIPTNLMLSPSRKTFQSVSIKQMGLEPFLTPFSILSAGNGEEGMTNTKQIEYDFLLVSCWNELLVFSVHRLSFLFHL